MRACSGTISARIVARISSTSEVGGPEDGGGNGAVELALWMSGGGGPASTGTAMTGTVDALLLALLAAALPLPRGLPRAFAGAAGAGWSSSSVPPPPVM